MPDLNPASELSHNIRLTKNWEDPKLETSRSLLFVQFVIKDDRSGEYLVDYSLDRDIGFYSFDDLPRIISGLSQPCIFESQDLAIALIAKLLKNGAYGEEPRSFKVVSLRETGLASLTTEIRLAIRELLALPEIGVEEEFNLYLVKADPKNRRHNPRLPTADPISAAHLLTTSPAPGDLIDFVLEGHVCKFFTTYRHGAKRISYGEAELSLHSYSKDSERVKVAFESNLVANLWIDKLNGADWDYAAVEVEVIAEPEDDDEFVEWLEYRKIKASCRVRVDGLCPWQLI